MIIGLPGLIFEQDGWADSPGTIAVVEQRKRILPAGVSELEPETEVVRPGASN